MKHKYNNRQSGLSIVELLVALALGATLTAGISGVYLENKRNFVQDEEMARLQENGRFAIGILKREIKMAGFYGGVSAPVPAAGDVLGTPCVAGGQWTFKAGTPVDFIDNFNNSYQASSGDTLLASCFGATGKIVPGTDVLMLKRTADRPSWSPTNDPPGYDSTITAADIKANYWYMRVVNLGGQIIPANITFSQLAANAFPAADMVIAPGGLGIDYWLYQSYIFFIRDYAVEEDDGLPTLVMASLKGDEYIYEPLVDGVEAFNVEFGIRQRLAGALTDDLFFVENPTQEQLARISVVRLHLLMRTREELSGYTDTRDYWLGQKEFKSASLDHGKDPDDDRDYRRRVFTTTVKIRNF